MAAAARKAGFSSAWACMARGLTKTEAGKINFPSAGLNLGPSAGLNLGHMGHMGKQYIRVYAASAYKYTYKRNVYIYVYTRRADYARRTARLRQGS